MVPHKAKSLMLRLCPPWQPLPDPFNISICILSTLLSQSQTHTWSDPGGNHVVGRRQNRTGSHSAAQGVDCPIEEKRGLHKSPDYVVESASGCRKGAKWRRSEDRECLLLFSVSDSPPGSGQMVTFHTPICPRSNEENIPSLTCLTGSNERQWQGSHKGFGIFIFRESKHIFNLTVPGTGRGAGGVVYNCMCVGARVCTRVYVRLCLTAMLQMRLQGNKQKACWDHQFLFPICDGWGPMLHTGKGISKLSSVSWCGRL